MDGSRAVALRAEAQAWWPSIVVALPCVLLGPHATTLLCALLSELALRDFLMRAPTRAADRTAISAAFLVALPLQYALAWIGHAGLFAAFLPVYGGIVLAAMAAFAQDREHLLARVATLQFAVMVFVFGLSHVAALATLRLPGFDAHHGALLAWFLLVALLADELRAACGKWFGKHAIAPALGLDTSWEGLAGGAVLACGAGVAAHRLTPFAPAQAAVLAAAVVLAGLLGRLALATAGRMLGIKARGAGHAGVLDRVDAVVFAAPVFFHLVRFWFAA